MILLVKAAKKLLDVQLPCTEQELKKAYRREVKLCHPDLFPGDRAKEDRFKKLSSLYERLTSEEFKYLLTKPLDLRPRTAGGDLLSDLGKGVTGGELCASCQGQGYTTLQADPFIRCQWCRGSGFVINCPLCKGRGKGRFGDCGKCEGLGRLGVESLAGLNMSVKVCAPCSGRGGFRSRKPIFNHYKCGDCNGAGQRVQRKPLWQLLRGRGHEHGS